MKSLFILLITFSLFISGCELLQPQEPRFALNDIKFMEHNPDYEDFGWQPSGGGNNAREFVAIDKSGSCSSLTYNYGECVNSLTPGYSNFVCSGDRAGLCDNVPGYTICEIPGEQCSYFETIYSDCECVTEGGPVCGDAIINQASEECDVGDLNDETCVSQGFTAGNLQCTEDCTFDISDCSFCGNGIVDVGEECDSSNLNGQTCVSIDPDYYLGGNLSCFSKDLSNECEYDLTECVKYCGNGVIDFDEECDQDSLGGMTCQDFGFAAGDLDCYGNCYFDTSGCIPPDCSIDRLYWEGGTEEYGELYRMVGTEIELRVYGDRDSCLGKTVSFEVMEDDLPAGVAGDDHVNIEPLNAVFVPAPYSPNEAIAISSWRIENQDDGLILWGAPEYYFNVRVFSESTFSSSSRDHLLNARNNPPECDNGDPSYVCVTDNSYPPINYFRDGNAACGFYGKSCYGMEYSNHAQNGGDPNWVYESARDCDSAIYIGSTFVYRARCED